MHPNNLPSLPNALQSMFSDLPFSSGPLVPSRSLPSVPVTPPNSSCSSSVKSESPPVPYPTPPGTVSPSATLIAYPIVSEDDCPLTLFRDDEGHRQFARVCDADRALSADDDFVKQISVYEATPHDRCELCIQQGYPCGRIEAGVDCPACHVLGTPDCKHRDIGHFLDVLKSFRMRYLSGVVARIRNSVEHHGFPASSIQLEYNAYSDWMYRGIQGAIERFNVLRSVRDLAMHGYVQLVASATDVEYLSRCLVDALKHGLHPSVARIIAKRIVALTTEALE